MASSLKKIAKVGKYCEIDYFVSCITADKRAANSKSNKTSKNSPIKIILNAADRQGDRLSNVF